MVTNGLGKVKYNVKRGKSVCVKCFFHLVDSGAQSVWRKSLSPHRTQVFVGAMWKLYWLWRLWADGSSCDHCEHTWFHLLHTPHDASSSHSAYLPFFTTETHDAQSQLTAHTQTCALIDIFPHLQCNYCRNWLPVKHQHNETKWIRECTPSAWPIFQILHLQSQLRKTLKPKRTKSIKDKHFSTRKLSINFKVSWEWSECYWTAGLNDKSMTYFLGLNSFIVCSWPWPYGHEIWVITRRTRTQIQAIKKSSVEWLGMSEELSHQEGAWVELLRMIGRVGSNTYWGDVLGLSHWEEASA